VRTGLGVKWVGTANQVVRLIAEKGIPAHKLQHHGHAITKATGAVETASHLMVEEVTCVRLVMSYNP